MIPTSVSLRPVADADLPLFFEQQLDPEANHMAAFTAPDPTDRAAFDAHWAKIRANPAVFQRTIVVDGGVAGYVGSYGPPDEPEVTYWLGRAYWGRGLATQALRQYIDTVELRRPLYGRAAADNTGSLRVLEKCGFTRLETTRDYANARGEVIDEVRLILPAA